MWAKSTGVTSSGFFCPKMGTSLLWTKRDTCLRSEDDRLVERHEYVGTEMLSMPKWAMSAKGKKVQIRYIHVSDRTRQNGYFEIWIISIP